MLPDRQQADIALSGAMDVRNSRAGMFGERKLTLVYATVNVETSQGIVWTVDAKPGHGKGDHVANRAKQVAAGVLQGCQKRWKEK